MSYILHCPYYLCLGAAVAEEEAELLQEPVSDYFGDLDVEGRREVEDVVYKLVPQVDFCEYHLMPVDTMVAVHDVVQGMIAFRFWEIDSIIVFASCSSVSCKRVASSLLLFVKSLFCEPRLSFSCFIPASNANDC